MFKNFEQKSNVQKSFKILIRISPAVVLFQSNPSITSFTVCALTGWKENFAWLLTCCLILLKLV